MMTMVEVVRRERGLTKRALSNLIKCNAQLMSAIENYEKRPWPSLRSRLAEALAVEESLLFLQSGWARPVSLVEGYSEDNIKKAQGS